MAPAPTSRFQWMRNSTKNYDIFVIDSNNNVQLIELYPNHYMIWYCTSTLYWWYSWSCWTNIKHTCNRTSIFWIVCHAAYWVIINIQKFKSIVVVENVTVFLIINKKKSTVTTTIDWYVALDAYYWEILFGCVVIDIDGSFLYILAIMVKMCGVEKQILFH